MVTAKKTTAAAAGKPAPGAAPADSEARPPLPPAHDTRAYSVGSCPVLHDGRLYPPGHELVLTDAQAARLGRLVSPIPAALPDTPTTVE